MYKSAYISNLLSKVSGNKETSNEEIEKKFSEIIKAYYGDNLGEKSVEGEVLKFQEAFGKEIERDVIRSTVVGGAPDPEEILKRSRIIKEKIDKENFPEPMKKMISLSIIRGYFTACKHFLKKSDGRYIESFTEGLKEYAKYPDKIAFEILLKDIDFKTGPLSEDDIKLSAMYFKTLHKRSIKKLEMVLDRTGCFGISGCRGMGKSTLLNVCILKMEQKEKKKAEEWTTNVILRKLAKMRPTKNQLIIKLTVPSRYEPDEFLITVLSRICEEIKREGDLILPYRLLNVFNVFYKLFLFFLISLGLWLLFFLAPNIFSTLPDIYYNILVYATLLLGIVIIFSIVLLSPNKILTYRHVDRIHSDIKFKKTFETTKGASSKFFSFGRRTTFVENPVNYTTPLLSDKLSELIEDITKKTFNKVILIIDDFDKLSEWEYTIILKNIRFLSSTKKCLTFISVPEGFEERLENMDSEARTLFDQFIKLEKIKDTAILQTLIEHRIMSCATGREFSKNKELIEYENLFYTHLLLKSDGVPREAIRLFDECFMDWYAIPKEKTTIDADFY